MGNQCGCGKEEDPAVAAQRLKCLIRIQARMRTYLARKKRNEIRAVLFAQIFSKFTFDNYAESKIPHYFQYNTQLIIMMNE